LRASVNGNSGSAGAPPCRTRRNAAVRRVTSSDVRPGSLIAWTPSWGDDQGIAAPLAHVDDYHRPARSRAQERVQWRRAEEVLEALDSADLLDQVIPLPGERHPAVDFPRHAALRVRSHVRGSLAPIPGPILAGFYRVRLALAVGEGFPVSVQPGSSGEQELGRIPLPRQGDRQLTPISRR
jgi:hypothetical protein